jgi:hypothetical protein
MLTAPSSLAHVAAEAPKGQVVVATVDAPRAGLP